MTTSSKDLVSGAKHDVLAGRIKRTTGLQYFGYRKGADSILIKMAEGNLFEIPVTPAGSAIVVVAAVASAFDAGSTPADVLDDFRRRGEVEGAVQYLGADPFVGEWAELVQTPMEKEASAAPANTAFTLEI